MYDKLVTIVVPVYNVSCCLNRCIDSIIAQSYRNIEVILVNDGSSDNSLDICRMYEKEDSRIKVINKEKNKGVVRARKSGIREAKGEYISFIDSDDWVDSNYIELLISKSINGSADLVCTSAVVEKADGIEYLNDKIVPGCYEGLDLAEKIYPVMLCTGTYYEFGIRPNLWNKLFKKQILDTVYRHIHDKITYGEDAAAVYPAILYAKKVVIASEGGYHYCIRRTSMCFEKKMDLCNSLFYLFQTLSFFFHQNENVEILMDQLKQYVVHIDMHNMRMLYGIDLKVGRFNQQFTELINKKIIIYGAGEYGRELFWQLKRNPQIILSLWIDKNYKNIQKLWNEIIYSPDNINKVEYDYILIAVKNKKTAMEIFQELRALGIDGDKILWKELRRQIEASWISV